MTRILCLALSFLAASSAAAPTAEACVNDYVKLYVLPEAVRRVERVERLMAQGNSRAAYPLARELVDGIVGGEAVDTAADLEGLVREGEWMGEVEYFDVPRSAHPDRASAILFRAQMLHSILVIRVDGQITRDGTLARRVHPSVRASHLEAARSILAHMVGETNDNPRLTAYVAEAQAGVSRETALATLRDIAARDLVADPLTWVALAELESGEPRADALERCRTTVTRRANRVCRLSNS